LYNIRPGNGAGLFLQPRSPHRGMLTRNIVSVTSEICAFGGLLDVWAGMFHTVKMHQRGCNAYQPELITRITRLLIRQKSASIDESQTQMRLTSPVPYTAPN